MREVERETADRFVVADRDGWQCWLCTEAIDPQLKYPDPGSLSVDHVVPLAQLGPHAYRNVRAAHLTCNVKRGAPAA